MNIKFKASFGWEIQIVDTVEEAEGGFYILYKYLPQLIDTVKRQSNGKVVDTAQAKKLMAIGYISLK
jgi:hypothetical protein